MAADGQMKESEPEFSGRTYHASRIPARDALSTFVPADSPEPDAVVQEAADRAGCSRWYPETGGHRVIILYEGGPFDANRFTVEKGAWDHEHCMRCGEHIAPMVLCWVTWDDPYVALCQACHTLVPGDDAD